MDIDITRIGPTNLYRDNLLARSRLQIVVVGLHPCCWDWLCMRLRLIFFYAREVG